MSEDNDILKELEGIVNDASANLKAEWVARSKQLLRAMNDHTDQSDELSKQSLAQPYSLSLTQTIASTTLTVSLATRTGTWASR